MLPDPLQRLQAQYDQLVTSLEQGHIDFEQAKAALVQMVVLDGSGAQWSINVDGAFTRAAQPGQPGQPTDPSHWAADRLPPRPDAQDVPPWADERLMGGQPTATGQPGGWADGPQQDAGMGQPSGMGGPLPAYTDPQMGRAKKLGQDPDDSPVARVLAMLKSLAGTVRSSGVWSKVPGDRRTLIVIGAGLALLLFLVVYTRLGTDPLDDGGVPVVDPTANPTAPADGAGDGATNPLPTDGGAQDPTPEQTDPVAGLPTNEHANQVIAALTSADREVAASVLVTNGGLPTTALQVASLAGLDAAQVAIKPGPAADAPDGKVTAVWQLVDALEGTVYATATVEWVPDGDGWKLRTWPQFTLSQ